MAARYEILRPWWKTNPRELNVNPMAGRNPGESREWRAEVAICFLLDHDSLARDEMEKKYR